MTTFAHLITPTGLTAFISGKQYSVPTDHPNFRSIVESLKAGKYAEAIEMIDIRASVRKFISTDARFALVNDLIEFNGVSFCGPVTDKVLELIEAGNAPAPLFAFLEKVRLNPSKAAQDELLLFCVANDFMIDTEGNIVAYKAVRENYKDMHSGTFDNSVGVTNKMSRFQVDDDRNHTCSAGLHFASFEYARDFAAGQGHLMVITVNPKDVVSIPSDYNNQKGRCAEYKVVAELGNPSQPLPKKSVYTPQDMGVSAAQIRAETAEALEKAEAKRERKCTVRGELQDEIDDLEGNIDDIKALGGLVPMNLNVELLRKKAVLEKIENEIEDLDVKIDVLVLESEFSE